MLKHFSKKCISLLLALCLIASVFTAGVAAAGAEPKEASFFRKVSNELASTGNFFAEKAMEKVYDIGMRAVSCGLDAAADATGKSGKTGWETAISFVNDWVFKDASEVAIAEVEELCREILHELDQIETQINNSISIVDSMVSKSIIESAKQAVNTQWDNDVTTLLNTYGAKNAFDAYKQYVSDAIAGEKTKEQMQSELDGLIDDFYLMYTGESQLGEDKKETMFTGTSVNGNFEKMIKALADNLDKSGSVIAKAAYFAYMAYPFSHQQYTYVYSIVEKQLVYLLLTEMMYNEYLFQQGEYLAASEAYGRDSDAYKGYDSYQQRFYDLMMNNAGCVNEHIGNMLETKITVDSTGGISLGLEDYMKPEDAVSVPMTILDYEDSHDFWSEAVNDAKAYNDKWSIRDDTNISSAEYVGKTVWCKRVMTHSTYGSRVFYIVDPEKMDAEALKVRNYMNKIDLKCYKDVHTPICDYINLMKDMGDGVNVFATTDSYGCESIAPLFAPNAFLANGNKINNYLNGYLPADSSGNNYLLTPMRRYDSNKKGMASSYVKYKVADGSKQYAAGVSIDSDEGSDEVDTEKFDNSSTAYENDRFTVILANKDTSYKRNVSAALTGNTVGEIRVYTENGGQYLDAGDSMQVESGTMLTVKMKNHGYIVNSLTVTRSNGEDATVTLLESDDFDHLSADEDGWYELHYPMPYSDATFTLDVSDEPMTYTASIGTVSGGSGSFSQTESAQNVKAKMGEDVHIYFTSDPGAASYWNPRFTETATGYSVLPDYDLHELDSSDGRLALECVFTMTACDVTVSMAFDDFPVTASLGTLEHCTGTMGYLEGVGYGIDKVHDTGETSISAGTDIRDICAIITVEDGYSPPSGMFSVRSAATNEPITVKTTVFTDVDADNHKVYYIMFPRPEEDVVIDVVCEQARVITADAGSFVYDNNNNPTCYIDFVNSSGDYSHCGSVVTIPTYGNYFTGDIYIDEYHELSHIKLAGTETGKVYYDADIAEPIGSSYDGAIVDSLGDFLMSEQEYGVSFSVMFMNDRDNKVPEDMLLTATFARNDTPIPTEAPTEAPTYYSAMLSSFTGGTPTFELGSVAVMRMKLLPGTEVPFYVTAPKDYEFKELTVTGDSGTSYPYRTAAEPYAQGDDMIYSFAFDMPEENVVIRGRLEPAATEAPTEAPTDAPTDAPTEVPTDAPTDVPTEAPTDAPTEEPTEAPEPAERGIRTYDELVEFARLVRENYAEYGSAHVWLENNIIAPADSEWTQGVGSLRDDKPFNGTFDGNGYCIIGLNINNSEYGSLFEYLGEDGVIKDLMIFDTRFKSESHFAAGIAVYNEGTIDHCVSGINVLGRTKITLPSGKTINPADYNSIIKGELSAGVSVVNSGTITGCRNGSVVEGDYCAGIAGRNDGVIYGSTNNGAVGTNTSRCQAAGGIAVQNKGCIASSYNSGKINCGNKKNMGTVAVYNGSDEVNHVFFNNVNSIPAIGSDSDNKLNESNQVVENPDMLTPAFVELLNGVSDETIAWVQAKYGNTYFNQGYPTILGRFLEQNTQYLTKEITITGLMHSSLKASAAALDTESEEYQALSDAAGGRVLSAYSVATTDENGSFVPAELWISGSVQLSIPLDDSGLAPVGADGDAQSDPDCDIALAVLNDEGEATLITPDSIVDGRAVFTLAAPKSFAVVKQSPVVIGDTDLDGEVSILDATLIQRYLAELDTLSDAQKLAADVDGDGDVTILDATLIQRWLAEIIKRFPAEEV